ncbi:uncharacterized protein LOC117006779 isoform X3 [Catharus ustulatus]|uniref:uncharacterized protein LOC117006779 isoform X3 n=1 Tax=Catharus ustulatus TaxID=91951 RepID=UPI00140BBE70|nr:uncharacterized protein LOC117006779 isoform X3 [Catharus ustulatus]
MLSSGRIDPCPWGSGSLSVGFRAQDPCPWGSELRIPVRGVQDPCPWGSGSLSVGFRAQDPCPWGSGSLSVGFRAQDPCPWDSGLSTGDAGPRQDGSLSAGLRIPARRVQSSAPGNPEPRQDGSLSAELRAQDLCPWGSAPGDAGAPTGWIPVRRVQSSGSLSRGFSTGDPGLRQDGSLSAGLRAQDLCPQGSELRIPVCRVQHRGMLSLAGWISVRRAQGFCPQGSGLRISVRRAQSSGFLSAGLRAHRSPPQAAGRARGLSPSPPLLSLPRARCPGPGSVAGEEPEPGSEHPLPCCSAASSSSSSSSSSASSAAPGALRRRSVMPARAGSDEPATLTPSLPQ